MIKAVSRVTGIRWPWLIAILSTSSLLSSGFAEGWEIRMTAAEMSVWELINRIGEQSPLQREGVERIFRVTLKQLDSSNRYFTFWNGDGGDLKDKTRVSRILLSLRNGDRGDGATLTLDIAGACHTLSEISARYGEPALIGVPSGQSEDEETTYEVKLAWGRLTFGFNERRPDCVSSVGFAIHPAAE